MKIFWNHIGEKHVENWIFAVKHENVRNFSLERMFSLFSNNINLLCKKENITKVVMPTEREAVKKGLSNERENDQPEKAT